MRPVKLLPLLLLLAVHTAICTQANCQTRETPPAQTAQTSNPPNGNTPLTQPAAPASGEDKSYLSSAANYIVQYLASYSLTQRKASLSDLSLPLSLISYSARLKTGSGLTAITPEFTYIDVLGGVELGVQDITLFNAGRTVTGPGLSLRIDLSPSRFEWVSAYNNYRKKNAYKALREGNKLLSISDVEDLISSVTGPNQFLDKFALAGRSLRVSTFFSNQWLDSTRITTGGVTVSQVLPLTQKLTGNKRVWGMVPRFALQAIATDISGEQASKFSRARYSSSVRTSIGFALQNEVPRVIIITTSVADKDGNMISVSVNKVTRWNFQFGGEYVFKNATDGGESYGIYTRFRDLKAHTETFFSIGRAPSHDFQFGVGMTFTHE